MINAISLVAVRERERESYTLLNKNNFNNICKKQITIKPENKAGFIVVFDCIKNKPLLHGILYIKAKKELQQF